MDMIEKIWGSEEHLNILQMSVRALMMFFIALLLIRLGGMRIFGKKSALDTIIVIMLGAVLARGIVGASDYWATIAASAVLITINRAMAFFSQKSQTFDNFIKGKPLVLYEHNSIQWDNMKKASLTESDLMESLRLEVKKNSLEYVEKACIENNGRISFIVKDSK